MPTQAKSLLTLFLMLCAAFGLTARAAQTGFPAPELVLPRIENGQEIRLSEFLGKVVYVDFWASWCTPCRRSLPLYEDLSKRFPADRFQILAVNLDEDRIDAENFLEAHPVSYPILLDASGDSARDWAVSAMPSSYLVDSSGKLAYIYIGFESSHIGKIEHDIKTLLELMPVARPD